MESALKHRQNSRSGGVAAGRDSSFTMPLPQDSVLDEDLVRRAKAGSTQAYDYLVRRHQSAVRGFLRRIVYEPSFADDLAQETFLKAWQSLGQWRGASGDGGSFKGWLFSIAWNKANDARKSQARSLQRDTTWTQELDSEPDPESASRARLDLDRVLQALSPDQRLVVSLCFGAGLSHAEAAQALKMPLGTVKSHALRGRDKAIELLKDLPPRQDQCTVSAQRSVL
jgi:RNA polymerase sigma factor (sigma-70 family)